MKKLLFVAVVAFAAAVIGPPALAAPAIDAQIAIERAAPAPAIVHKAAVVAMAIASCDAGGVKFDLVSPAMPAPIAPNSRPGPVAAAVVLRDLIPVAHPLLL